MTIFNTVSTSKMESPSVSTQKISVGYARVSTREQAVNSHALEQQIARLKQAGAELIIHDIQSGKKDDRSGLLRALQIIENGEVSELILTRIDRLGRRVPIIRKCVDTFQNHNVTLRVLDQNVGLGDASGRLMLNLLASFAEMEVDQLSERIQHGNRHRRDKHLACGCAPFGYTVIEEQYALDHSLFLCLLADRPVNYRELDQLEVSQLPGLSLAQLASDCIALFYKARNANRAVSLITEKYGIKHSKSKKNGNDKIFHWTPSGFKRWLTNPVLQGHTAYLKRRNKPDGRRVHLPPEEWQIVQDTHPCHRLITDEQASQIRQILDFNAAHRGAGILTKSSDSPTVFREFTYLRDLVFCAECGSKAVTKTRHAKDGSKIYYYYACRYARKGCENLKGTSKPYIESELIKFFLQQCGVIELDPNTIDIALSQNTEKLQQLKADLEKLEKMRWQSPDLERVKQDLRQQMQDELNPFSQRALERKTAQEIIQAGNNLVVWNLLTADEKVAIIPRLVERITVANGQVKSIILKA
jgi:site-specific DNA recombinase